MIAEVAFAYLLLLTSFSPICAFDVQDKSVGGFASNGVDGTAQPDALGGLATSALGIHDLETSSEQEVEKGAFAA